MNRIITRSESMGQASPTATLMALVIALGVNLVFGARAAQSRPDLSSVTKLKGNEYAGLCDASAAVAISDDLVIVASDEENKLRVYRRDQDGPPLHTFDVSHHLGLHELSAETDIEGAAGIGDRVYWITSHSRNNDGRFRPNRHRFFATRFRVDGSRVEMTLVGNAYSNLLRDLAGAPALRPFNLGRASLLPPKEAGALNIEGLSAMPDGRLLIGFRNPIPQGKALLVPLENPDDLLEGRPARFGAPILLDLGGLGIRDMGHTHGRYVIIGGSHDGKGRSQLFSWDGVKAKPTRYKSIKLKGINPEALAIYPDRGFDAFQLFSDDSSEKIKGRRCGDLKDEMQRRFRSIWIAHDPEILE